MTSESLRAVSILKNNNFYQLFTLNENHKYQNVIFKLENREWKGIYCKHGEALLLCRKSFSLELDRKLSRVLTVHVSG